MNDTPNSPSSADDWQQHVQAWKLSSLSKAQFCKTNEPELCYHRFIYWCRKLEDAPPIPSAKQDNNGGFVPVKFSPNVDHGLTLALPNGCVLQGINTENVPLVQQLLKQLS